MAASEPKQGALTASPVQATDGVDQSRPRSESPEPPERQALVAEAAFFIAKERGFVPGHELDDWLAAERVVDQNLSALQH